MARKQFHSDGKNAAAKARRKTRKGSSEQANDDSGQVGKAEKGKGMLRLVGECMLRGGDGLLFPLIKPVIEVACAIGQQRLRTFLLHRIHMEDSNMAIDV